MATEQVTLKFLGSKRYYFTATKPGRRGARDGEELLQQFARGRLGPVLMHRITDDDQPGFIIIMSLIPKTDQLKMLYRVKQCFAKAGYKLPRSSK